MSVEICQPVIPAVALFRSINEAFFGQASPLPAPDLDEHATVPQCAEEEAARVAVASDAQDHGQR
jgi:hypothetical protein